jgi:ribosomal protein S18 acetylase RimI-like enzyme
VHEQGRISWHTSNMDRTNIRRAGFADIPALMKLRAAVSENRHIGPNKVSCEDVAEFLDSGEIWVWEEGRRILGFSAGDTEIGWIWALFVDPGHEGRGIGRALLALACRTLVRAGFTTATLTTDPGTRAARFYRRAGWNDSGRTEDGEIIFKRRLDAKC